MPQKTFAIYKKRYQFVINADNILTSSFFDTQTISSQQRSHLTHYWLLSLFCLRSAFDKCHDLGIRAITFYYSFHQLFLPHLITEFDQLSQCFFLRFILRFCFLKSSFLLFYLRIQCICVDLASSACHRTFPPIS